MTADTPRYAQIFNTLSKRMQAGKYPVDMRLPTESELCDEFNASRFTVREALRRLVEQGMVQRRQGAGSVVVSTTPQAQYVHSLSSLSDLFQFALDTHYDLLSIGQVILDARVAEDVGVASGERWHLVQGVRSHEMGGKAYLPACNRISPRAPGPMCANSGAASARSMRILPIAPARKFSKSDRTSSACP